MSKTEAGWVTVDMDGLAQIIRRKGLAFILNELVQNAWDTDASETIVQLEPIANKAAAFLTVYDNDPHGFTDLAHAYTLFAPSAKKSDPSKRGRFNLGEKLVLAACTTAKISSTTGTIYFERQGKKLFRRETKECLTEGSKFEAEIRMTREEMQQVTDAADLLLPPSKTIFNGRELPVRKPLHTFEATLPTEVADEEGVLRRSARKTEVHIYAPSNGTSYLYELGIPVVETEFPWAIEIHQKVPLNADRDNITPAYQRQVGVLTINEMHDRLQPEEAALPAVQEALGDDRIDPDAVESILTHQYGDKRVAFDPSDPESNSNAFAHGHNVIPGRAFSKDQWRNIKRSDVVKPAGQVFPTPQPYSEGGRPRKVIPQHKWTGGMQDVAAFAEMLAQKLMGISITVTMESEPTQRYGANYGHRELTFNVGRLGKKWFHLPTRATAILDLIIHEFAHEYGDNHLDEKYHKAATKLGAKATMLALNEPGMFRGYGISTE